jgi:LPLT family lysophospholipid transporter-like MFS transporter
MNKNILILLIAQFLSAFADNAILFIIIAIVMQSGHSPQWYIPALQSAFLVAYVICAPWAGQLADRFAKTSVLIAANLVKAVGALLMLINVEPLLAYGVVGVGAALYSPAKYGILPELAGTDRLIKANSWIEGSTILAILLGTVVGAKIADVSISLALELTFFLFIGSAGLAYFLPKQLPTHTAYPDFFSTIAVFGRQMGLFFTTPRARFAMLGGSLFWAAAATLRLILVAWAPLVLAAKNASDIAQLTLYLAIGIIVGSALVPRLISLAQLRRARIPAFLMGLAIAALAGVDSLNPARGVLFVVGMMGGLFIVPINAALQHQGSETIGSGSAVALQNFFQNLSMLIAVGAYTGAAAKHITPNLALISLGVMVFIITFAISLHLPRQKIIELNN